MSSPTLTDHAALFRLYRRVEDDLAELDRIRAAIAGAWLELGRPGANPPLVFAHLLRLRSKRDAARDRLRSLRAEARELLGRPLPDDEPETWPAPSSH